MIIYMSVCTTACRMYVSLSAMHLLQFLLKSAMESGLCATELKLRLEIKIGEKFNDYNNNWPSDANKHNRSRAVTCVRKMVLIGPK